MTLRHFIFRPVAFMFWSLIFVIFFSSCFAKIPIKKDEAFSYAVNSVQSKDYATGARAAWMFVSSADPDDPRYDRGLRLLARSAEGMQLYWAAGMIYRQIAKARRNVALVPDAIKGIKRLVESEVFDEDMLITSFVASEEFGKLNEELAAFVEYYKGLDLIRRGLNKWARERFKKIPKGSSYYANAIYVKAVQNVAYGDYQRAYEYLMQLKEYEQISDKMQRDVERTLARLAFEEKRFQDALEHFKRLKELAPDDPEILLETAWTLFYLGDSRRALGLLIALDAPIHRGYISPERYLLQALALRRLCQFGAAREAAVRLEKKYADALASLEEGVLPQDIPQLRKAARLRGVVRKNTMFTERLKYELILLKKNRDYLGKELADYLKGLYQRGKEEALRRENEIIHRELNALTEELLAAREGVKLIVHELGVSLLRGRRRPEGVVEKEAPSVPIGGKYVFYPFNGEFWTDELDDLFVVVEDRCID